jgi:hypothetical protein
MMYFKVRHNRIRPHGMLLINQQFYHAKLHLQVQNVVKRLKNQQ